MSTVARLFAAKAAAAKTISTSHTYANTIANREANRDVSSTCYVLARSPYGEANEQYMSQASEHRWVTSLNAARKWNSDSTVLQMIKDNGHQDEYYVLKIQKVYKKWAIVDTLYAY